MTVTEWYNKRKGQSLLVPGAAETDRGQCVQAADYWLNEGFGLPYVWANAVDWWGLPGSLSGNFDKIINGVFKPGDFVIYSEGIGKYGHIDVVAQDGTKGSYIGYDSNWGNDKTLHQVTHNQAQYNQFILGVLRRKGSEMASEEAVELTFQMGFLRSATRDEQTYWQGFPIEKLQRTIYNDPLNDSIRRKALNYDKDVAAAAQTEYVQYSGDPLFAKKK